jgi:hypothetical protein
MPVAVALEASATGTPRKKIGITENVFKTLGDIGNRWPPQTTCANCAGRSGALLPPSPPAEKATANNDQAGQASTCDGAGNI